MFIPPTPILIHPSQGLFHVYTPYPNLDPSVTGPVSCLYPYTPILIHPSQGLFHVYTPYPNLDPSITGPGPHQTLLIRRPFRDPSTSLHASSIKKAHLRLAFHQNALGLYNPGKVLCFVFELSILKANFHSGKNKQRIGQDQRFFRSGPIQQAISSKRASGMIGSEKGKNGARSSLTSFILQILYRYLIILIYVR